MRPGTTDLEDGAGASWPSCLDGDGLDGNKPDLDDGEGDFPQPISALGDGTMSSEINELGGLNYRTVINDFHRNKRFSSSAPQKHEDERFP